jgi:hypothetical protein
MGKVSSEGPRCCFHWGQKSGMPKSSEIPQKCPETLGPTRIRPELAECRLTEDWKQTQIAIAIFGKELTQMEDD